MIVIQYTRSVIFIFCMYAALPIIGLLYLPAAIASRASALAACHAYCRWVRWSAGWMVGLRSEVRGEPPTDEVLIAAKHQSFFDIILIFGAVPRGRFIMKKQLKWAPVLGWYALRIGCIPVDRGKRGQAIAAMKEAVEQGRQEPGQLIIYPEGTRRAPGAPPAYKIGSAVLYTQLAQDCVPVAANVGVFWPRHGILRKPGTAVVEFLPRIEPGLPNETFMQVLQERIETASDRLLAEAGFTRRAVPNGD